MADSSNEHGDRSGVSTNTNTDGTGGADQHHTSTGAAASSSVDARSAPTFASTLVDSPAPSKSSSGSSSPFEMIDRSEVEADMQAVPGATKQHDTTHTNMPPTPITHDESGLSASSSSGESLTQAADESHRVDEESSKPYDDDQQPYGAYIDFDPHEDDDDLESELAYDRAIMEHIEEDFTFESRHLKSGSSRHRSRSAHLHHPHHTGKPTRKAQRQSNAIALQHHRAIELGPCPTMARPTRPNSHDQPKKDLFTGDTMKKKKYYEDDEVPTPDVDTVVALSSSSSTPDVVSHSHSSAPHTILPANHFSTTPSNHTRLEAPNLIRLLHERAREVENGLKHIVHTRPMTRQAELKASIEPKDETKKYRYHPPSPVIYSTRFASQVDEFQYAFYRLFRSSIESTLHSVSNGIRIRSITPYPLIFDRRSNSHVERFFHHLLDRLNHPSPSSSPVKLDLRFHLPGSCTHAKSKLAGGEYQQCGFGKPCSKQEWRHDYDDWREENLYRQLHYRPIRRGFQYYFERSEWIQHTEEMCHTQCKFAVDLGQTQYAYAPSNVPHLLARIGEPRWVTRRIIGSNDPTQTELIQMPHHSLIASCVLDPAETRRAKVLTHRSRQVSNTWLNKVSKTVEIDRPEYREELDTQASMLPCMEIEFEFIEETKPAEMAPASSSSSSSSLPNKRPPFRRRRSRSLSQSVRDLHMQSDD